MDSLIIKKAQRGDHDCFSQAVGEVQDHAYRIAYSFLGNKEDSMDAVCDAIEKAFKQLKNLKEPLYFRTWFIRIVINECKQQLRRRERFSYNQNQIHDISEFIEQDSKLDIEIVLKNLDPLDRMFIYMKYMMGYTFEEIAMITEVPQGTVKSRVYSNLRSLRDKLVVG